MESRQMYTYRIGWLPNDSLFGNLNHSLCAVRPNGRSRKLCAFPRFPHGRARTARRPAILDGAAVVDVQNPGGEFWTSTSIHLKTAFACTPRSTLLVRQSECWF